ncbi:Uncharacterised protein [Mycobacteroides abscessus]|nr:Uncharacterised protein [Mycobacteroides abscessus]
MSETIASASPRTHSTGAVAPDVAKPDRSQYFALIALFMPRVPGATPGHVPDAVRSPG